jgi:hypothetical protein
LTQKKQVYRKEIELDGDLTWEVLRRAVDELLAENNLPADVKIDYLDWSQGSSYGHLLIVVDDGGLTVT